MALELEKVSFSNLGDPYIHETSLSLMAGEFNVLLGTTLAGKTTLMRLMAGLDRPDQGRVLFEGRDVTGLSVQQRNVAMVYQQFINYPNFTVYENIASPLRIQRKSAGEIRQAIMPVAEMLKLEPMLDRLPGELSGGQQQRTALARALVKKSALVLLDEPLANLDYKLREELREELPKLFRDVGATVVYATSEPAEALLLGGCTATLHEGRVTQFGRTADVYRNPLDLRTAQVFSDPPVNTCRVNKSEGRLWNTSGLSWKAPDKLANLPDSHYLMGIRAHRLRLTRGNGEDVSVEGTVQLTEISGSESTVHARVFDDAWVCLSHGIHNLQTNERIRIYFDPTECLYFDETQQRVA